MKRCPTCGSRYPDDFDTCNTCSTKITEWFQSKYPDDPNTHNTYKVPLIDNKIANEINYYGIENKKLQKKYPEECRIYLEAQEKIQKIRQEYYEESKVTISKSAIPTRLEPKVEDLNVNIPKCPICQSTDLSPISSIHKAGKILMFGIFGMGDNGKTWKCNNCGSKF